MAEISVIVPVYNVEKYLRQAIESLQNQSFSDFEAILVNDGSPDNCLKIMQDYANKDNRFIVLNQENQGSGQARNNALKIAKSPYITFLDPDDYLGKDFLKNLYEEITKTNADIVETSYTRFYEENGLTKIVNLKLLEENIDYTKDINEDYLFYLSLATWNKIYKREFLEKNNIAFSKNPVHDDVLFTVTARFLADKIRFINKPEYFFRVRKGSITHKKTRAYCSAYIVFSKVLDFLKEKGYYEHHKESVNRALTKLSMFSYVRTSFLNRIEFINEAKRNLPQEAFTQFIKQAVRTEFDNLFSVKNIEENGKRYKILNIFWQKFKLKELPPKE